MKGKGRLTIAIATAALAVLGDCGHACHVAVKAKDHIFHPYQKR